MDKEEIKVKMEGEDKIQLPISYDKEEGVCIVTIIPELYPLDVIYTAGYVLIDKAYIILDCDINKRIRVILKPKNEDDLDKIGFEFYNELLNYSVYDRLSKKNKTIRDAILNKALLANEGFSLKKEEISEEQMEIERQISEIEDMEVDGLDEIAKPWEEKFGIKGSKIGKR